MIELEKEKEEAEEEAKVTLARLLKGVGFFALGVLHARVTRDPAHNIDGKGYADAPQQKKTAKPLALVVNRF